MEITTMCLRGLGAGHWAGLRRNGVAEPVMRGLVKNIGGMPDEPHFCHNFVKNRSCSFLFLFPIVRRFSEAVGLFDEYPHLAAADIAASRPEVVGQVHFQELGLP